MSSDPARKHQFHSEMEKLLEAGFDIRKAAATLATTRLTPAQAAVLDHLQRGLDAGESITSAISRDPALVSPLERTVIEAGERGGKLAPAFGHLADYFGMVARARREVLAGLAYPLVILHLGIVIATVPSQLLRGDRSSGEILGSLVVTLILVYAVAALLFFAGRALVRAAPEQAGIDRFLNRLPWIGKARRHWALARFSKVFHMCLLAGIPMQATVQLAAGAAHSAVLTDGTAPVIAAAAAGQALGPALMAAPAFPAAFSSSYATGEEAGTLDKDLARWSVRFQEEAEDATRTAAKMVPKVLYFLVIAFAAWQVIGFFTGYYEDTFRQLDE